jgi:hypothetical protein
MLKYSYSQIIKTTGFKKIIMELTNNMNVPPIYHKSSYRIGSTDIMHLTSVIEIIFFMTYRQL